MSTPQVHALGCIWTDGNGTWETGSNWTGCTGPGGIPGPGDRAIINSGTVTVTANEASLNFFLGAGATMIVNSGVTLTTTGIDNNSGSIINYGTITAGGGGGIVNSGSITNCAGGTVTGPVIVNPVQSGGAACAAPVSSSPAGYPSPTIGGVMLTINRLQILLPWLTLITLLGTISVWTLVIKRKRTP
jgi:hypothetical protein